MIGEWIQKGDSWVYRETTVRPDNVTPLVVEKMPSELGYVREIDVTILFCKEYPSRTELDEIEKVWFSQDVHIAVRPEQTMNIWLKLEENKQNNGESAPDVRTIRKVYLHDLSTNGHHLLCPLQTTANIIVTKKKPKRVSLEEASEIAKKFSYVFGAIEKDSDGSETYRIDVAST